MPIHTFMAALRAHLLILKGTQDQQKKLRVASTTENLPVREFKIISVIKPP